jgi:hypothetical protein
MSVARTASVVWLVAVAAACGSPRNEPLASNESALTTVRPQFLTLPFRPEQPDGSGEGIVELDHRFIWNAPLENGLPPPMNTAPAAPGPAAPLAARAAGGGGGATGAVDASNAHDSYQGETGAAFNGTVLVGGSNSIFPGACGSNPCYVRAYTSSNGTSYTSTTLSGTWGGATFGISFDPSLDHDLAGNFYYAFGGAPLSGSFPNSIGVAKSGPSGLGWSTPVAVTFNKRRFFDDKYYLAVDRSASAFSGRVYVSWDRNVGNNQILYIAFSADGGGTWSAPVKVNDGTTKFERVIGAYPAVDHATGVVYDSWHDYAKDVIFVDRSTTGGTSWGTDVAAATTHTGFGVDIGCVGGRSQSPAHHLKVGPSGALHLVYADSIAGRGFDVLYTRSTDGGQTWSAPVRLDDDAGAADQFHPTLSVGSNGAGGDRLAVSFYDRRDDPANCLSHVYSTTSVDGGATWSANVRQTATASDFDGNPNGPGDYSSSSPSFGGGTTAFHSQHVDPDFEVYAFPF